MIDISHIISFEAFVILIIAIMGAIACVKTKGK